LDYLPVAQSTSKTALAGKNSDGLAQGQAFFLGFFKEKQSILLKMT
jgi:hypothetical protein